MAPMMSGARVPQVGKKYIPTAQAQAKTNFFSKLMTPPAPMIQKNHAPSVNAKIAQVPNFIAARNAAIASVAAMTIATAPQQAMAADIEAGKQIFEGNCAACHAGGNNVIQNEKTLRREALNEYLSGGFKETSIVYQVTNGKNAMPAFGGKLDEEDIKNVAAYVYDTASGDKWDDQ